jgi:hypothetical protein
VPDPERIRTYVSVLSIKMRREFDTRTGVVEIEELAKIEVTSEDPNFPIEAALSSGKGTEVAGRRKR